MGVRRWLVALVTAGLAVSGATACEPAPPRPQFVVTSELDGADSVPGDGVCASAAAEGACTLRAAVEESNALGVGDVTFPAGSYGFGALTVTGDVSITGPVGLGGQLSGRLSVAEGGRLRAERLDSPAPAGLSMEVWGTLHVVDSRVIGGIGAQAGLVVHPGASAVAEQSMFLGWSAGVGSLGSLVLDRSWAGSRSYGFSSLPESVTVVRASWVGPGAACAGEIQSLGYNHGGMTDDCGLAAEGDTIGGGWPVDLFAPPPADDAVVDAIPLGSAGCTSGAKDILGNPRGVDGNGDGIGGCDVGPYEVQP